MLTPNHGVCAFFSCAEPSSLMVLEELIERTWPPVYPQMGSPYPFSCAWNVCSAHCSHGRSRFQGCSLEKQGMVENLWIYDWTQLRSLYKLSIFWQHMQTSTRLAAPKISLAGKSPCLLNLPSTHLEWPASSCILSLPLVYRGRFRLHPGSSQGLKPAEREDNSGCGNGLWNH